MANKTYSIITGTGSYIPTLTVKTQDFISNEFFESDGNRVTASPQKIIDKFIDITNIVERRHVSSHLVTSDIAYLAAVEAIESANINKEHLDYIIVAHNFGDIHSQNNRSDIVPSLAARVKHKLEIENPNTVAYDLNFGCPGWLQAVIQANYYIKSGDAKKILVIGAEVLSRVSDPHDRDSMIYADGAGAVIIEACESEKPIGILGHATRSDTLLYSKMLQMGHSFYPVKAEKGELFLKMNGRRLYQYALETVPQTIKACLEKYNLHLNDIKKFLIHQANGKMDDAILQRLYALYDIEKIPENIMPMTVSWLGNSSVATLPTLLDLIKKNKFENQHIASEDIIVFASVGAGMNVNAVIYKN